MKRFAVIGLGHFGAEVARKLYEEGKEIVAIDSDKEIVQEAAEYSSQAICCDATELKALEAIGIKEVDVAIVALGERMDAVTLTALHLKELVVPYLIVKAISTDHEKILKAIGVDEVVHPEEFTARSLAARLSLNCVANYLPLIGGYSIVEIRDTKNLVGKMVSEIESQKVQVVAIQNPGEQSLNLVPKDDYRIGEKDTLILIGENQTLEQLTESI